MDNSNWRYLYNAPKKYLLTILTKMHIQFDYTSDKKDLADLAINHLNHLKKLNDQKVDDRLPHQNNQICYQLFFVSLFLALLGSFILMLIYLFPHKTVFCNSHLFDPTVNKKCIPCPIFATCSNGSCLCDLNYTRIKNYCIFNDEDKFHVYKMIYDAYNILKKRAGSYYCHRSEIDWMSVEELEGILLENSKLNISKFNVIFKKALPYLNQNPNLNSKIINNITVFISTEIKTDIYCEIQRYLYQKYYMLIIALITIIFVYIILFFYKRSKKKKIIATRYSRYIVDHLKQKNGVHQSKAQLIYNLDKISNNNGKKIWPLVENQLHRYSNIQSYNDEVSSNYRFIE